MPNRVEGAAQGTQPAAGRPDAAGQAQRQQAAAPAATANQTDTVEISQAAQTRNREMQAANTAQGNDRGAAMDASGARPPQGGEQGNVERASERNAEQLREQQTQAQQEAAQEPQQGQGTGGLVDITG